MEQQSEKTAKKIGALQEKYQVKVKKLLQEKILHMKDVEAENVLHFSGIFVKGNQYFKKKKSRINHHNVCN